MVFGPHRGLFLGQAIKDVSWGEFGLFPGHSGRGAMPQTFGTVLGVSICVGSYIQKGSPYTWKRIGYSPRSHTAS
eukprot:5325507-Pyramimonas_sp.AAC.1